MLIKLIIKKIKIRKKYKNIRVNIKIRKKNSTLTKEGE